MLSLSTEELEERREAVRRLKVGSKVETDTEAARYVDERGFCLLMRLPNVALPSISEADVRRPWAGFDITDGAWRWKETLPAARLCAYQKLFVSRGTFISWRLFPAFYVLYGPRDHYEEAYRAGALDRMAYLVLQAIEARGPISSRDLWSLLRGEFGNRHSRFEGALTHLQRSFYITVSGGSLEGWSLHDWDLVERQAPEGLLGQLPSLPQARTALLLQFIENMVVCTVNEIRSLLRWNLQDIREELERLSQAGDIVPASVEGLAGPHWALASISS